MAIASKPPVEPASSPSVGGWVAAGAVALLLAFLAFIHFRAAKPVELELELEPDQDSSPPAAWELTIEWNSVVATTGLPVLAKRFEGEQTEEQRAAIMKWLADRFTPGSTYVLRVRGNVSAGDVVGLETAIDALGWTRFQTIREGASSEQPLAFDETPSPPLLGASPCLVFLAPPSAGGLSNEVLALMTSSARSVVTPPNGKWIWSDAQGKVHVFQPAMTRLTPAGQVAAFKAALNLLSNPERSTLSITTRKILRQLMPTCNWDKDLWPAFGKDSLSKDEYNLFTSVWYLVQAAAKQVNYVVGGSSPWHHLMIPTGAGPGLVIGRGFLALPEVGTPGKLYLEPGRRIELVVGEYTETEWPRPPFFHAEVVYARVIETTGGRPRVEILATFGGKDVSPKFSNRHGIKAGRILVLPGLGAVTTGIRKIHPAGVQ